MSFELMNTSLSLVPWAIAEAVMAPTTMAANATAAVFPDAFMVSISDAVTRINRIHGPRSHAMADTLTYFSESTPLMIARLTTPIVEGQSRCSTLL
jgi:precorrin-3B methylase